MSPKLRNWYVEPGLISPIFGRRSTIAIDGTAKRTLVGITNDLTEDLATTTAGIKLAYDPAVAEAYSKIYATERNKMAQAALCDKYNGAYRCVRVYIIEFSHYRGEISTEMPWFPDTKSETEDFVTDEIINKKANLKNMITTCTAYEATSGPATFLLEDWSVKYDSEPVYTRHYVFTNQLGAFTVSVLKYKVLKNGDKIPVKFRIDTPGNVINPGFIKGTRILNGIPSYLPANMRAITLNDNGIYPVASGVKGQTRFQSPSVVNVLRKLYEEFGQGFDIAIRTFYTNYAVMYIRFLPSEPFSSSQLYIRVPSDYKDMYAVLTIDVESLIIDGIYPSGLNLLTSDVAQFTTDTIENVTANAAIAGAMIGGSVIEGIGKGVQAYAQYKQWQEQLAWYKESQQNLMTFSREYQGKQYAQQRTMAAAQYEQQRNMAVLNTELAGYRTGASAYGFSHTDTATAGLGYTPSNSIKFGGASVVSNWDPAAHLPESKRIGFVKGKTYNEQGTTTSATQNDEGPGAAIAAAPLLPHQQLVQAEVHNEDNSA